MLGSLHVRTAPKNFGLPQNCPHEQNQELKFSDEFRLLFGVLHFAGPPAPFGAPGGLIFGSRDRGPGTGRSRGRVRGSHRGRGRDKEKTETAAKAEAQADAGSETEG